MAIRNKILGAFEQAEAEEDPSGHRDLITFVLFGAGPTGVEMAIHARIMGTPISKPFRYFNKGIMAVMGKASRFYRVARSARVVSWPGSHGPLSISSFLHNRTFRVSVFVQWVWTYLTGQRGSRLIVKWQLFAAKAETSNLRTPDLPPTAK